MCKIKSIILFATLLLLTQIAKAQIPSNDSSWHKQPILSEEFNAAIDTVHKWYPRTSYNDLGGADILKWGQLDQSSGTTIKIKIDTLIPSSLRIPSSWDTIPSNGATYVYKGATYGLIMCLFLPTQPVIHINMAISNFVL